MFLDMSREQDQPQCHWHKLYTNHYRTENYSAWYLKVICAVKTELQFNNFLLLWLKKVIIFAIWFAE